MMQTESTTDLLQELEQPQTSDQRRLKIGQTLAAQGDPRTGVGVVNALPNIAWLPVAPAGEVAIIRHWRPDSPDENEVLRQVGKFWVHPFYIAKYLITNEQYQAFVNAEDGFADARWWAGVPQAYQRQPLAKPRMQLANQPRDTISWYQAMAFARWLNHRLVGLTLRKLADDGGLLCIGDNAEVRLPTEWEWQWAAQNGAEERRYPWGDKRSGFANTAESGLAQGTAVGMYPHGAAACSACDMAGNLMEWCLNDKMSLELNGVASVANKPLRGGDWGYGLENATCTYCDDEHVYDFDPLNGFRLIVAQM